MISFIYAKFYILLFGILQIFFTAPGQTFLIALFVDSIFNSLTLSLSMFAGIYSASTLLASLFLNPAGRLVDQWPLKRSLLISVLCFSTGCFVLAFSVNLWGVFLGFFILRLFGQGVFGLIASTTLTKKFEKNRGKALGVMTLGIPLSELIYPTLALFLLSRIGWRFSFVVFGVGTALMMIPVQRYLIHYSKLDKKGFIDGEDHDSDKMNSYRATLYTKSNEISYTLKSCLKDYRFYLALLSSTVPPVVMTGIFFHQASLFSEHGWLMDLAASGLASYAIFKAIFSVYSGSLVDRHGPWPYFVLQIILMSVATFLAALGGHYFVLLSYFSLYGAALGMGTPVLNVIWANFYGVNHMGSIKGFIGTIRNGVTALAPLPIAVAMDCGIGISKIFLGISVGVAFLSLIPLFLWFQMRYRALASFF